VSDDPLAGETLGRALQRRDLTIDRASTGAAAIESVLRTRTDLVFLDAHLPDISGMSVLEQILKIDSRTDVVLLAADGSAASAVEAIRKGAHDCLARPFSFAELNEKIDNWLTEAHSRRPLPSPTGEALVAFRSSGIVGESAAMLRVFTKARSIAPHFQTLLITGETGTGKESISHAVHTLSKATGRFVTCNCAAIVETLFESELFGHVRGAFTGAIQDKAGLVEEAPLTYVRCWIFAWRRNVYEAMGCVCYS